MLKGALGLSDDDISHFNGLFYARDTAEALAMVRSGEYDAAFLMRPTPVEQVRDVAAEGENMPPKSTFFFPKLLDRPAVQPAVLERPRSTMSDEEFSWRSSRRDRNEQIARADKDEGHRAARRRQLQAHGAGARPPADASTSRCDAAATTPGPTPQELLAVSLASCTAITMEMYAARKGWDIGHVEVDVEYSPAERGCPTKFELVMRLPDDLPEEQVERLRVIAAKCPVHRALDGEVMFQERIERVHLAA